MQNFLLQISPYLFIISTVPLLIVARYLLKHFRDIDGDIKKLRNILLVIIIANLFLMIVEIFIIFAVIYKIHIFTNDRLILLALALSVLAGTNWYALIQTRNLRKE